MSARQRTLLPGSDVLRPLRQGDFDCLCGLYSAINAVRLTLYPRPLMPSDEAKLFAAGLKRLSGRWDLHYAVGTGMSNAAMADVARVIAKKARARSGLTIVTVRAAKSLTREQRDAWLAKQFAKGNPVLAEFKVRAHFSVCCGFTAKRVVTFGTSGRLSTARTPTGRLIAFVKESA